MILKIILICIFGSLTNGSPIIYSQPYNNHYHHRHPNAYPPSMSRGYLTPPRAITTLNTFVPRALIKPAKTLIEIPRVYETPKPRTYTPRPIFRPIPPAPTSKSYVNKSHNHSSTLNSIKPKYAYSYSVNDNRTGDHKNVEERLENGVVRGSYSLVEADGTTVRRVTYTASDATGFVANVERTNRVLQPLSPTPPPQANNNNNIAPFTIFNP